MDPTMTWNILEPDGHSANNIAYLKPEFDQHINITIDF